MNHDINHDTMSQIFTKLWVLLVNFYRNAYIFGLSWKILAPFVNFFARY